MTSNNQTIKKCKHPEFLKQFIVCKATRCVACGVVAHKFETTEPFTIEDIWKANKRKGVSTTDTKGKQP